MSFLAEARFAFCDRFVENYCSRFWVSYALAETGDGYDNQLLIGHKDNDTLYLYVNDVKHKAAISGDLNGAIQYTSLLYKCDSAIIEYSVTNIIMVSTSRNKKSAYNV